jgi:hypothetical protein
LRVKPSRSATLPFAGAFKSGVGQLGSLEAS